jgi:hypothetical protein
MSTAARRHLRRSRGLPTWRIVRYADDFVILVHGSENDTHALREEIAAVLAPMGLRLSMAKTSVQHMRDGFEFLGFHIQWRRKAGTAKWCPAPSALTSSKPPLQHGRNNPGPVEPRPPGPPAGPPSHPDPKITNCSTAQPPSRASHPSA